MARIPHHNTTTPPLDRSPLLEKRFNFAIDFSGKWGNLTKAFSVLGIAGRKFNMSQSNQPLDIVAYLKPHCGWSEGVRAIMRKYDLSYEDRDIINDPSQRQEMIEKSGQMLSPCVQVNGTMLADVSGEEVEAYLLANRLVSTSEKEADAPTNAPCPDDMHDEQAIQFRS